jgi:hypothetical protein
MQLIKLIAPEGATSLSFESTEYEVVDGAVEVPAAAVEELIGAHGYAHPESAPVADTGEKTPKGDTSVPPSDTKPAWAPTASANAEVK